MTWKIIEVVWTGLTCFVQIATDEFLQINSFNPILHGIRKALALTGGKGEGVTPVSREPKYIESMTRFSENTYLGRNS